MYRTVNYGICTPFLSPTMGFLSEPPVPTVGDLQLFQNKMTNAQTNALGWGGRGGDGYAEMSVVLELQNNENF